MWTYVFAAVAVAGVGAAIFAWRLYKDAMQREIATSEVLCATLLSPVLHGEFQDFAYQRISDRFPTGHDAPSEREVALLQQELMTVLGNGALGFVKEHGHGNTLRRILTGPFVVGRNPDDQWRFAGSPQK